MGKPPSPSQMQQKISSACGTIPTEHLVNAGRGPQASLKEKFPHTRESPHTQGQWGDVQPQRGAQQERCSEGKNPQQRLPQTGLLS